MTFLVSNQTDASSIDKLDISALAGQVKTTSESAVKSLSVVARNASGSITRNSRPSNAFITHNMQANVEDIDYSTNTNSTTLLSGYTPEQVAQLQEASGMSVTNDEELSAARGSLVAKMKAQGAALFPDSLDSYDPTAESTGADMGDSSWLSSVKSSISRNLPDFDFTGFSLSDPDLTLPKITDENGNPIMGVPSSISPSLWDQVKDLGNTLCNMNLMDILGFAEAKELFDALLDMVLKNGLFGLLGQMSGCGKYFTSSSVAKMVTAVPGLASKGDAQTIYAISNIVGAQNIPNKDMVLRNLVSRAQYNPQSLQSIQGLSSSFGIPTNTLYQQPSYYGYNAYSLPAMATNLSTPSGTKYSNTLLGSTRTAAANSMMGYGQQRKSSTFSVLKLLS